MKWAHCLCFSPHAESIAAGYGSNDITRGTATGEVYVWNASTGERLCRCRSHTNWVYSAAFSPDGKTLASGGWDGSIILWDVNKGTRLTKISGHNDILLTLAFSADAAMLASAGYDQTIKLWDLKTLRA